MKNDNWIEWQFYPDSVPLPETLTNLVAIFVKNEKDIATSKGHTLSSNEILKLLINDLKASNFNVEGGKLAKDKIRIPVLFGRNGILSKSFDVDAYDHQNRIVVEIEAGRAVTNHQFLKDFFEALVMIDIDYLVIAVRKLYRGDQRDFESVTKFFDIFYSSRRFTPPLKGLLIIGY
jgi:hypothetical protein